MPAYDNYNYNSHAVEGMWDDDFNSKQKFQLGRIIERDSH